jgi:hypothetical protein
MRLHVLGSIRRGAQVPLAKETMKKCGVVDLENGREPE